MNDEILLGEAAQQQGQTVESALLLLRSLQNRLSYDSWYVYRTGGSGSGAGGSSKRRRTLLAFPSGDSALAFAQRNRLGPSPRLLRLSLARLLMTLLNHAEPGALLFVLELSDDLPPGHLPEGLRMERADMLAAMERGGELD